VLLGGKENTGLKAVTKKRTRAIFLSRMDSTLMSGNILDHIKETIGIPVINCFQLKTKYPTYSSFFIEVDLEDFGKIYTSEVWPAGCLISVYYGRPREEQMLHSSNNSTNPQA